MNLVDPIRAACSSLSANSFKFNLRTWEELDIAGRFISSTVFQEIVEAETVVADITFLNFNVIFEIGYSIGCGKSVILTRNRSLDGDAELTRAVGIIDTLGYKEYSSSSDLECVLSDLESVRPLDHAPSIDISSPVFVLMPRIRTDPEIRIASRLRKARLPYRLYDPEEQGRLSGPYAIEQITKSLGVICCLLPSNRIDSQTENLRASFASGLAMGAERELLLFQLNESDPVPIDYRDLVVLGNSSERMDSHLADFSSSIYARSRESEKIAVSEPDTLLARVSLGASAAENEVYDLGSYYLETDDFRRASAGDLRLVVGRKGSGKTALFLQLRNRLRRERERIVLDLKPEGFQLIELKEQILDFLEAGTREHTITAFWEYLLYLEVCHKLLEKDIEHHLRDHTIYDAYRYLNEKYGRDAVIAEGDFGERMLGLVRRITGKAGFLGDDSEKNVRLASGQITELLYSHDIGELRSDIVSYLAHKKGLSILFDNLDKGWPANGVTADDILLLRALLDAMSKLEKEVRKHSVEVQSIAFIRNDVFELLVKQTPDRGKIASAILDWTDPDLLRELLRKRIICTEGVPKGSTFEQVWGMLCTSHYAGEETSQYFIDRCLMRPRALIDLIRACRSRAINLHHDRITVEDIEAGEESFSREMLVNIDLEIRDVFPVAEGLLYEFIESPASVSGSEIETIVVKKVGSENMQKSLDLLIWYGFIGLTRKSEEAATYIHTVGYEAKHIQALIKKRGMENCIFRINPAFWKALEVFPGTVLLPTSL